MKPLSTTWIISVFIAICLLEIVQFVAKLAMITALKCPSLSHPFRCIEENLGKTVPSVLRPRAVSKTKGTVFPNTDWRITYVYLDFPSNNHIATTKKPKTAEDLYSQSSSLLKE